jgi:hypothetical protein
MVDQFDSLGNNISTLFPSAVPSKTIWLSSDGITWTQRTAEINPDTNFTRINIFPSVAYSSGSQLFLETVDPANGPATLPLADKNLLAYNSGTQKWEPTSVNLDFLSDVDTSSAAPTDGQVLTWDQTAGKWEPATPSAGGGGSSTLDGLTDVDTSTPAPVNGQVLTWNEAGSVWKPGDVMKSEAIEAYPGSRRIQNCIYVPQPTWSGITTPIEDVLYVVTPLGQGGTPSFYYYPSVDPNFVGDADALAYLSAVEMADGQALEPIVRGYIQQFILDCKADSIWDAIKSSCIYAGARTVAGALVSLKGANVTNNGFVAGDYNRVTGLKGNGSSKWVNTNRLSGADPQDDQHLSAYVSELSTINDTRTIIGTGQFTVDGSSLIYQTSTTYEFNSRNNVANGSFVQDNSRSAGFVGMSRNNGSNFNFLIANRSPLTYTRPSEAPYNDNIYTHASGLSWDRRPSDARISFFSIGTSIDLAKLRNRVNELMANLASALA